MLYEVITHGHRHDGDGQNGQRSSCPATGGGLHVKVDAVADRRVGFAWDQQHGRREIDGGNAETDQENDQQAEGHHRQNDAPDNRPSGRTRQKGRFHVWCGQAAERKSRITSYNVCYTKLLRGLFVQYLNTGKVLGAKSIEDVKAFYEAQVPAGRGCTALDVAKAIFYVIEQEYETGQAVPVTGGQNMLK